MSGASYSGVALASDRGCPVYPSIDPSSPVVRGMRAADWPEVEAIWAQGIASGMATFEVAPPCWADFDASRSAHLRLVAEGPDRTVAGWAAAGPVSGRRVYAGVAEQSVYVRAGLTGRGVGRALLQSLVDLSEATGTWTLRSGIFPENVASLRLHAACGFREIGRSERVGRRDGSWRDVVLIERRSPLIGGDDPLIRLVLPGVPDDLTQVRGLLASSGLPAAGLDDAWRTWVADADGTGGRVIGSAALERYGEVFLLRSVAVDPAHRGDRLGEALVRAALRCADLELGRPATVCLLTGTAVGWFERFGFVDVDRSALPAAVGTSTQLRGACPDTARAYLRLGGMPAPRGA